MNGPCLVRGKSSPRPAVRIVQGETGASCEPGRLGAATGSTAGWISYAAISPIPSPPPVRRRAEPLSHRLPLQGGVILEASTRLPVELYHSPLEGESQKPSRRRRLMRRGAYAAPQSSAEWPRLMRWGVRLGSGTCDGVADTGQNSGVSGKGRCFFEQVMRPSVSHSRVVIRSLAGVLGHRTL